MRPIYVTKQLAAADQDAVAASQTPLAGGALTLTADPVVLDTQRQILFTFAADETGREFLITGTDDQGHVISETVAGTATTAVTALDYKTVTEVTIDAASAGAIEVGTNGVGATPPIPLDQYVPNAQISIACVIDGTVNFTVQYTLDDVFAEYAAAGQMSPASLAGDPASVTWWDITALATKSASTASVLTAPARAIRTVINSGDGSVETQVVQQGTQ